MSDRAQRAGDWTARRLPALAIHPEGAPDEWAVNDFVAVRRGAGQLVAEVSVDDELYVRLAGDGVIVASPLGSSAYSMAATVDREVPAQTAGRVLSMRLPTSPQPLCPAIEAGCCGVCVPSLRQWPGFVFGTFRPP